MHLQKEFSFTFSYFNKILSGTLIKSIMTHWLHVTSPTFVSGVLNNRKVGQICLKIKYRWTIDRQNVIHWKKLKQLVEILYSCSFSCTVQRHLPVEGANMMEVQGTVASVRWNTTGCSVELKFKLNWIYVYIYLFSINYTVVF